MFYYLSGTVAHIEPYLAVIDCGGVGYACRTTSYTLSALKKGDKGKVFTHLNVREDAMELYGFATQEELNLFQQLISVSGVGPKAALSILSASTPANLALSIITGDEKALTCAQGIGKKIAQRVILELKDKLAKGQTISAKGEVYGGSGVTVIPENKLSEASAALAVLGYSQGEINVALKGIDLDSLTLEQIIKAALKKMMKPASGAILTRPCAIFTTGSSTRVLPPAMRMRAVYSAPGCAAASVCMSGTAGREATACP